MTRLSALRPHQVNAMALLRESLVAGKRRPVLQMSTGAGKTVIAAHIIAGARSKGKRIAFCVPALSLVDQSFSRFAENGIDPADMGVMQGDHAWSRPHAPIQICSAQTLDRRGVPDVDVAVIDEAHVKFRVYEDWITGRKHEGPEPYKPPVFIGLSATPWTKGLGKLYDDLIRPTSLQELIDAGYLSPFRVYAPSHPDLEGVKIRNGDYAEEELAQRMDQPQLVADVVNTWLTKGKGRPTLCFATGRAHAKNLRDRFEEAGVRVAYVDANTPREEREEIGRKLGTSEIEVVCNIGCLTTGVDWSVECIILARPTKSASLFVQIIGRGLRTAPGKDHCIARGTPVLTDRGLVPIEAVKLTDRVWDGVSFVRHGGAVCKGMQKVMTYMGLTATPDHKVMTDDGWQTIETAARRRLRIARVELGGFPLWFSDNNFKANVWAGASVVRSRAVRPLQLCAHGIVPQHQEAAEYTSMSELCSSATSACAEVAISACAIGASEMHQSEGLEVCGLWRAWDNIRFSWSECCGSLDCGQSRCSSRSLYAVGSDRQCEGVCTGQFAVGVASIECLEYSQVGRIASKEVCRVQGNVSGDQVRRQDAGEITGHHDGPRDLSAVGDAIVQAEREVWDIHNAGPLQRFSAGGLLVHNCVILDHSDTHLRMGMVTDVEAQHTELDMGTDPKANAKKAKEKGPPLPKECEACGCLVPVGIPTCPACGHTPAKPQFREGDGALTELVPGQRRESITQVYRRKGESATAALMRLGPDVCWQQIKWLQEQRGRKEGWAAYRYKDLWGDWPPRSAKHLPAMEPCSLMVSWMRSRDMAWIKGKRAAEDRGEVMV